MTKQEAGRKGGEATVRKRAYGRDWEERAAEFYRRYYLLPIGTSQFGIFCKQTNQLINTTDGQWRMKNG